GWNIWAKPEILPDLRAVHAQERVRRKLARKGRGQRRFALASERIDLAFTRKQRLVLGLDRERKADIRLRIFVPAIDERCRRKRPYLFARLPHLRVGALDHPAASHREKRVSCKGYAGLAAGSRVYRVRYVIGYAAERVTGGLDHLQLERAEREPIALFH